MGFPFERALSTSYAAPSPIDWGNMGFVGEAVMLSRIMMPCGGNLDRGSVFPEENVQPAGANGAQYIDMLGLLLESW